MNDLIYFTYSDLELKYYLSKISYIFCIRHKTRSKLPPRCYFVRNLTSGHAKTDACSDLHILAAYIRPRYDRGSVSQGQVQQLCLRDQKEYL